MLMKAQRETKNSSSLYSFYKKVTPGYDECYGVLYKSYEMDGLVGCSTFREANDVKNALLTGARIFFVWMAKLEA